MRQLSLSVIVDNSKAFDTVRRPRDSQMKNVEKLYLRPPTKTFHKFSNQKNSASKKLAIFLLMLSQ